MTTVGTQKLKRKWLLGGGLLLLLAFMVLLSVVIGKNIKQPDSRYPALEQQVNDLSGELAKLELQYKAVIDKLAVMESQPGESIQTVVTGLRKEDVRGMIQYYLGCHEGRIKDNGKDSNCRNYHLAIK